jgi:putative protease
MAKKKKVVKKSKAKAKATKKVIKKAKKRVVIKKAKIKTAKNVVGSMVKVGEVTHYFPHVKAAALLILKDSIIVGDEIYLKRHTTDFKEKIASIQLDREPIEEGKKGQEIGLLVKKRVRIGDSVYKL